MNTVAALRFLIDTTIDLYAYIVLASFILQLVRADFHNPISQFVFKATNPVLMPLRKLIPSFKTVDVTALLLLLALQTLKQILLVMVSGYSTSIAALLIFSLISCFALIIDFLIFAIFVQVILSWITPGQYNPITLLLTQITEPILGPIRRFLPSLGGLDLSPMIALIMLSFFKILLGLN